MTNERDGWQAFADTAKQLALEEPPVGPAARAPEKIRLAALPLVKGAPVSLPDEERPDSAIREIPATLSSADARADEESVPPLDVDTELE